MARPIRTDGTGSVVQNTIANTTGQAATNGVITNTSQGAIAVANKADLNAVETSVSAIITALKAHGIINTT
jgi:hypothetical protein